MNQYDQTSLSKRFVHQITQFTTTSHGAAAFQTKNLDKCGQILLVFMLVQFMLLAYSSSTSCAWFW